MTSNLANFHCVIQASATSHSRERTYKNGAISFDVSMKSSWHSMTVAICNHYPRHVWMRSSTKKDSGFQHSSLGIKVAPFFYGHGRRLCLKDRSHQTITSFSDAGFGSLGLQRSATASTRTRSTPSSRRAELTSPAQRQRRIVKQPTSPLPLADLSQVAVQWIDWSGAPVRRALDGWASRALTATKKIKATHPTVFVESARKLF